MDNDLRMCVHLYHYRSLTRRSI